MATVGERVKKARKAEKLNQTQLSKKAGIAQSTLSALERGHNTTTKAIVALAIALRRRPQWLQHGTPPELVSEGDWRCACADPDCAASNIKRFPLPPAPDLIPR